MQAGDIAMVKTTAIWGALIRVFTRSRYDHAVLILNDRGLAVEAVPSGARYCYVQPEDIVVSPPLTSDQRLVVRAKGHALIGTRYNFLDVGLLGLAQLGVRAEWLRKRLARADRLFCSQLIDLALQDAGYHLFEDGRLPQNVSPGDLADLAFREGWPRA